MNKIILVLGISLSFLLFIGCGGSDTSKVSLEKDDNNISFAIEDINMSKMFGKQSNPSFFDTSGNEIKMKDIEFSKNDSSATLFDLDTIFPAKESLFPVPDFNLNLSDVLFKDWDRIGKGIDADTYRDIITDDFGNIYVVGYTFDDKIKGVIADYGYGQTEYLYPISAVVVKFDKDGNKLWRKKIGFDGHRYFFSQIKMDSNGNLLVKGSSYRLNKDPYAATYFPTKFYKFNQNGDQLWYKTFNFHTSDFILDSQDNIYTVGSATVADSSVGSDNNGLDDGLLVKINKNGIKEWDKTFGGTAEDTFLSIGIDKDGYIYVGGKTQSVDGDIIAKQSRTFKTDLSISKKNRFAYLIPFLTDDDDPDETNIIVPEGDGIEREFQNILVKFDLLGNILWAENSYEEVNNISVSKNGNIFTAGSYHIMMFNVDGIKLWKRGNTATDKYMYTFKDGIVDKDGNFITIAHDRSNRGSEVLLKYDIYGNIISTKPIVQTSLISTGDVVSLRTYPSLEFSIYDDLNNDSIHVVGEIEIDYADDNLSAYFVSFIGKYHFGSK